jgi:hypothetical protein
VVVEPKLYFTPRQDSGLDSSADAHAVESDVLAWDFSQVGAAQRSRSSTPRRPATTLLDKPAAATPRGSEQTFQNIGSGTGVSIVTAVPGGLDVFVEETQRSPAAPCRIRLCSCRSSKSTIWSCWVRRAAVMDPYRARQNLPSMVMVSHEEKIVLMKSQTASQREVCR